MIENKYTVIFGDSRSLDEINDGEVDLIVTSPPYWNRRDYGSDNQIGFDQSYDDYLSDMRRVWKECYRILQPGRRFCLNIVNVHTSTEKYGRHKTIPLVADSTKMCIDVGFDFLGPIIWKRVRGVNSSGGGSVIGSYPYPPNGYIKFDYEYILIFKKLGESHDISKKIKEKSKLSKKEWFKYFDGIWTIHPSPNKIHPATFPVELPMRLIKMFSFIGETVFDPFLGSGTTMRAARLTNRSCIGKELNKKMFYPLIKRHGMFGQSSMTTKCIFTLIENNNVSRINPKKTMKSDKSDNVKEDLYERNWKGKEIDKKSSIYRFIP